MAHKEGIDAALLDVRKAYRLIYLYQRRVLDICSEIVSAFDIDLNFYQWSPSLYEITPRRGTNPTSSRWAWDYLPLYDFCALYLPENVHWEDHKPGDWMLGVRIAADSGYLRKGQAEPDPRDFKEALSCESCMKLYIYYCSQAFKGNWYWSVYQNNDFPPDDGEGTFDNGIRTLGMKFSLVDVSNAEGVRTCVEEFKSKLKDFFPDIVKW